MTRVDRATGVPGTRYNFMRESFREWTLRLVVAVLILATTTAYDSANRPMWRAKYRRLLPFHEARQAVRSIGFSSREEWDDWVADGKSAPWLGPYMPSRPDEMYAEEWVSWEDFLGVLLPFDEARAVVHTLGISTQEEWWRLVAEESERMAELRVAARPHIVYADQWRGYDDWLGVEERILYFRPPSA